MRTILAILLCATALFAADAGRQAQNFLLPDAKGQNHEFASLRGKIVVLEFMQTTCPHCAAFTSILKRVQAKYGDRVAIVSVVNPPDTPANVSNFISEHKVTYPILLDAGRVAYAYLRKGAFDIPYLFLIDTNGVIREEFEYGPLTREVFEGNALFGHIDVLMAVAPGTRKN